MNNNKCYQTKSVRLTKDDIYIIEKAIQIKNKYEKRSDIKFSEFVRSHILEVSKEIIDNYEGGFQKIINKIRGK